jgi:hypothetical protein
MPDGGFWPARRNEQRTAKVCKTVEGANTVNRGQSQALYWEAELVLRFSLLHRE